MIFAHHLQMPQEEDENIHDFFYNTLFFKKILNFRSMNNMESQPFTKSDHVHPHNVCSTCGSE